MAIRPSLYLSPGFRSAFGGPIISFRMMACRSIRGELSLCTTSRRSAVFGSPVDAVARCGRCGRSVPVVGLRTSSGGGASGAMFSSRRGRSFRPRCGADLGISSPNRPSTTSFSSSCWRFMIHLALLVSRYCLLLLSSCDNERRISVSAWTFCIR